MNDIIWAVKNTLPEHDVINRCTRAMVRDMTQGCVVSGVHTNVVVNACTLAIEFTRFRLIFCVVKCIIMPYYISLIGLQKYVNDRCQLCP